MSTFLVTDLLTGYFILLVYNGLVLATLLTGVVSALLVVELVYLLDIFSGLFF
jgi:hypothetical protein